MKGLFLIISTPPELIKIYGCNSPLPRKGLISYYTKQKWIICNMIQKKR